MFLNRFILAIFIYFLFNYTAFSVNIGFYISPKFIFTIQDSGKVMADTILIPGVNSGLDGILDDVLGGIEDLLPPGVTLPPGFTLPINTTYSSIYSSMALNNTSTSTSSSSRQVNNIPEVSIPGVGNIDANKLFDNTTNVNNYFYGGGIAFGYNFLALSRKTPIRLELEYIFRSDARLNKYSTGIKSLGIHTFLFGSYYDVNFLKVKYNDEPMGIYEDGMRDLLTFYVGILLGARLNQYTLQTTEEMLGTITVSRYYDKFEFVYGFGLGFAVNITASLTLDIGYRLFLDIDSNLMHDIVSALRINF